MSTCYKCSFFTAELHTSCTKMEENIPVIIGFQIKHKQSVKLYYLLNKKTSICAMCGLTCVLITNLLAGLGGPLAAVVPDPLCGRICLIVEG